MNNLVFASVWMGAIGIAFLGETALRGNVERERARLAAELRAVEQQKAAVEELQVAGRAQLEQSRSTARALNVELSSDVAAAAPPPIDPEHEGLWPTNMPYFYLRKSLLPTANFQRFQQTAEGLGLSPITVAILGMTPAEALPVDEGFRSLLAQFKRLEAERLALVSVGAVAQTQTNWPAKRTTYRLPALREEIEPVVEDYFASVRTVLGNQRTEIYEAWAKFCITDSYWDFGRVPRIITLTDEEGPGDRVLTRFNMTEEGGKFLCYDELWNPPFYSREDRPSFLYRHLFGDHGRLRPGVPTSK
jgi:hypothetical protein